jgi:signal peptidase I
MSPTINNNSLILIDRFLYRLGDINKGDILIFKIKEEEMVKRLSYLPGEKFEQNGNLIELKKDEIYVLGDNPKESIDSRNYGPIKTSSIIGKVFLSF